MKKDGTSQVFFASIQIMFPGGKSQIFSGIAHAPREMGMREIYETVPGEFVKTIKKGIRRNYQEVRTLFLTLLPSGRRVPHYLVTSVLLKGDSYRGLCSELYMLPSDETLEDGDDFKRLEQRITERVLKKRKGHNIIILNVAPLG